VKQEVLLVEESGTQQTTPQQLSIFHELNESLMTSTTAAGGGKSEGIKEASEEIDSFIDVDD
jgi:hypothetical protein